MLTNRLKLRLTGTRPLIMARGEAANPFDPSRPAIEAISQKRRKSLEDHERLSRLQFESSMYYESDIGPFLPADNLLKCMVEGAQKYREGSRVKSNCVIIGLCGDEEDAARAKLLYRGPRDVEDLYQNGFLFRTMGKLPNSKASVLISRVRFNEWQVEFIVEFDEISGARILDYWKRAGSLVGIGAWRLRYGLFVPEVLTK